MAKGAIAKQQVENRIRAEFGNDFVGSNGKELFVWGEENGERVQIKIALTCPKTNYTGPDVASGSAKPAAKAALDWSDGATETPPTELTQEEKETVNELLSKLGL